MSTTIKEPYIGEDGHEYENKNAYEVFPGACQCCCDETEDDGGAASERRMLAGMAHGNQGLADLDGLELDR